jgi:DNA-binding CsgD family transcriptional regulator
VTLAEHLSAVGRFDEAIALAEASIEPAARWNRFFHASCLMEIGHGHLGLGQLAAARDALDTAIAAARTVRDPYVLGLASNARAFVALDELDLSAARSAILESLSAWWTLQRAEGLVGAFAVGGLLALAAGDGERAAELLLAIDAICREHDYAPAALEQIRIARLRTALGPNLDAGIVHRGLHRAVESARELASGTTAPIAEAPRPAGLTQREMDVLRLLAEGRSDREIAESLGISRSTAARHVANIFLKLEINSRTAVAAWAFRQGLLPT